ncbi:MAG TPA: hypothetical protein VGF06_10790 [Terriglobales bacterium]|jgi:hypothetical protein
MFPRIEDVERSQILLNRFDEVGEILRQLARLVLSRTGEFHSVMEITNQVFDQHYRARAA